MRLVYISLHLPSLINYEEGTIDICGHAGLYNMGRTKVIMETCAAGYITDIMFFSRKFAQG